MTVTSSLACVCLRVPAGVLATAGVEMQAFSGPAARAGEQWFCVGLSSLLGGLGALNPLVKEAAQLSL